MPLYEFCCSSCNRKFTQLLGMTADSSEPACPKCGSGDVKKLISRFSRLRSEDEVLESMEDSLLSSDIEDPKSMRKFMREMGKGLDEDGGDDLEEYMEEAEREIYDGPSDEDGGTLDSAGDDI